MPEQQDHPFPRRIKAGELLGLHPLGGHGLKGSKNRLSTLEFNCFTGPEAFS
jgi:hypothetical protein